MHQELVDVARCNRCKAVVSALHLSVYDDGMAQYWRDAIPHSLEDCNRVFSVSKEEWPYQAVQY